MVSQQYQRHTQILWADAENDRAWRAVIFDLRRLVGRGSLDVGQACVICNLRRTSQTRRRQQIRWPRAGRMLAKKTLASTHCDLFSVSNPENGYQIEDGFKNGIKAMSTPVLAALHPETIQRYLCP